MKLLIIFIFLLSSCDKSTVSVGSIPYTQSSHELIVYWGDAEIYQSQPYEFVYINVNKGHEICFPIETDFYIIVKDGSFLGLNDTINLGIRGAGFEEIIEIFTIN